MKWVRVQILNTENDDIEDQLVFDLPVDEITDEVMRSGPTFGLWGSFGRGEQYPFIFRIDDVIDFGSARDAADRYWKSNIRNRPIRVGELCTIESTVAETYRVGKVVVL